MCPQFIHDLQEVMGTDGLHQLLQACGWLGVPLPENREDFMGHWIGFFGKILTGNHGFYHQI